MLGKGERPCDLATPLPIEPQEWKQGLEELSALPCTAGSLPAVITINSGGRRLGSER